MKLRNIISVPGNLMLLHHDAGHATIPELSFVPTSSASCIRCIHPYVMPLRPYGCQYARAYDQSYQNEFPAESRESCASGVLQLVRRLHSSTVTTPFGFGMMIPNVQFFRWLNFRISPPGPPVPLFLCHSNWSSWLNCPGDFWRNNDNWMPVLLAEFGGPGPRGVIGHFLGMVIGFEFLVQIFVCWAQGLCFHKYAVHRTKTTLLIQHSKYEQIYDCAVAIRRPIQGMTHSVPTISGSTVFAREQATAAQVLTMGRRIGTRAWNQTMGPIAERKK